MFSPNTKRGAAPMVLSVALGLAGPLFGATSLAHAQSTSTPATGTTPTTTDPKKDPKKEGETEDEKKEEEAKKAAGASSEAKPEEKEEKFSDEKESARAIYFSGDLGFTRPDMGGFSDSLGFDKTAANGMLYGLAAGLRLRDLRIGARWRVQDTTEFSLWSFAASVGYGLPIRPLSPIFSAHVGYVFDQSIEENVYRSSLPRGTVVPTDVDVKGLIAGVDVNASYWVTKFLRLGVFVGFDFLFLHRDRADVPRSIFGNTDTSNVALFSDSGSGVGYAFNAGFRGAFDIGF